MRLQSSFGEPLTQADEANPHSPTLKPTLRLKQIKDQYMRSQDRITRNPNTQIDLAVVRILRRPEVPSRTSASSRASQYDRQRGEAFLQRTPSSSVLGHQRFPRSRVMNVSRALAMATGEISEHVSMASIKFDMLHYDVAKTGSSDGEAFAWKKSRVLRNSRAQGS